MKTTNKVIAVMLCACIALSAMVFSVSAEGGKRIQITVDSVQALAVEKTDPESVAQLMIRLSVPEGANEEDAAILNGFDTIDPNAEIMICESLCYAANALIALGTVPEGLLYEDPNDEIGKEVREKSCIAIAKPLSYQNGVLKVDVYSTDGTACAKMIAIDEKELGEYSLFTFHFPEGILKNADTGDFSDGIADETCSVKNLAARELKLTKTVENLIKNYEVGSVAGVINLLSSAAFLLPILPLELLIFAVRANPVYKAYGVNVYKMTFELFVKTPKILFRVAKLAIAEQLLS